MTQTDEADQTDGARCVLSPSTMKLVTLVTLLVSDFNVVFTWVAMYMFFLRGSIYTYFAGVIGFFFLMYAAGCGYAISEASKFIIRFKDKVKVNEIAGISLEDLEDALAGKRIFWMGCAAAPNAHSLALRAL